MVAGGIPRTSEGTDAAKISQGRLDVGGHLGDRLNALVGGRLLGSVLSTGTHHQGHRADVPLGSDKASELRFRGLNLSWAYFLSCTFPPIPNIQELPNGGSGSV